MPPAGDITSPQRNRSHRRRVLTAVTAAAVVATALGLGLFWTHGAHRGPTATGGTSTAFAWFQPGAQPAGWVQRSLPDREARLSYPPTLDPQRSDPGSVSVGLTSGAGAVLVYLNVTPRQGAETLADWADFRVAHLREETARAVRRTAVGTGLHFRGGVGSCVVDEYTTRVHANTYEEIACLVQGRHGASVLVAATLRAAWATYSGLVQRVVSAFQVS
ncbi:MAG TPA: hypothetical protein VNE21_00740 [Mycobacteriales bacterium]|nr:hypothetical protein [Mycobacteriales bacterium]